MNTTIELKNFKHFPSLSEETYCFTATIVVNGIKCGDAKNQGFGGDTMVSSDHTTRGRELIKEADLYCQTLPPYHIGLSGTIEMNLVNFIDDLVHNAVMDKAKKQDAKRLAKKTEKAVLYGNDIEYYSINFTMPIAEVMSKYPQRFEKHLIEFTKKHEGKGFRILNNNIPQQFLSVLN
jgi:hypothetical protein